MNMSNFKTNYNRVTNSLSSPRFLTTLLLLIVVSFLFNFNFDTFWTEAQQAVTVTGEGHTGYIPKWILATTVTISPSPATVYTGDPSTLFWSSNNATYCAGTNFNTWGVTSGSAQVNPISTTTYTITCDGVSSSTAQITITVKKRPKFIEI